MSKILIIEDDNDINNMLRKLLGANGYETVSAYSGTEALLLFDESIDLVLMDLMLPGKSGEEIIGELKAKKNVPVIVASAIGSVEKKVDLFALGASDYVTKPFDNSELLARIKVRLCEAAGAAGIKAKKETLRFENIEMDIYEHRVYMKGTEIELSAQEFKLLQTLMENPGRTYTKSMLFDLVWNEENVGDDNTLNVHISKIRKKLKAIDPEREYIETVWGVGYRMCGKK